jgi:hypothetical protein
MNRGLLLVVLLAAPLPGQMPPRAIRRTVPITNSFLRGLALGTRDSSGHPGPRYWQLTADYDIEARLDPDDGSVTGRETITIHNAADSALQTAVLRLYQNRFTATAPRTRVPPTVTRGMRITRLVANGAEVDLAPTASEWSATTVVSVPLGQPIPGGGTGRLEVEWTVDIPDQPGGRGGARGGRIGSRVFQVAQWYPQLAKYDDLRTWDREPHLGSSEFYNNFGRFDVRLTVPPGWLVGATGLLQNPEDVLMPMVLQRLARVTQSDSQVVIVGPGEGGAGRATRDATRWHFIADSVNDFAWATSPEYVWEATRATIPGRGPIPVTLLYLPEHPRYRETGAMARHALQFYSALWMPYPFPQFTQVDGPEDGMEYPMLTMSGPGFEVTDHEIGHQWWPMTVGTNETWYGWMDEGLNEYMNILSEADWRGRRPQLDSIGARAGLAAGLENQAPMMWDNNYGGPLTAFVTYDKAPMMLSMLGGIVGDSAVQAAVRDYARAWRFRHPSPWDFMFAMDRALGRNLDWFWYYWLFTTESSDGTISGVTRRGDQTRVTVTQLGEMPAPVVLRVEFEPGGVPLRRMANAEIRGDTAVVRWPVEVWFSGARTFEARLEFGPRRLARIVLDPAARFPDNNWKDNVWPR